MNLVQDQVAVRAIFSVLPTLPSNWICKYTAWYMCLLWQNVAFQGELEGPKTMLVLRHGVPSADAYDCLLQIWLSGGRVLSALSPTPMEPG